MDSEDNFEASLFVDVDYKLGRYQVNGRAYEVWRLEAASTDHDLTGQVVWPVSELLAWFVARKAELFHGKTVLELGAGCGLPGIVASSFAEKVTLTDGNDVVLDLAEKTVRDSGLDVDVRPLVWGDRASVERLDRKFDVILGADVVAWPNSVEPLLQTVAALLDEKYGVFYCGFVVRAQSTARLFFDQATRFGLRLNEIPVSDFLPADIMPASIRDSTLTLRLLEFRFFENNDNNNSSSTRRPVLSFLSDDPERYANTNLAC